MTFPVRFTTPVALITRTAGPPDSYGNQSVTESAVIASGVFNPGSSAEQTQGQDEVVWQPSLYLLDASVTLTAFDAVAVNPVLDGENGSALRDSGGLVIGDRYEVDGVPNRWSSPFTGWAPGVEIKLRKVTG